MHLASRLFLLLSSVLSVAAADHWAFEKPRLAACQGPTQSAIDALLVTSGEPQGPAPARLLERRLSLDLTGLPPLNESTISITERVDKLLASPRFGEHWGRHFMDIWRYSDWYGLDAQLRDSQKHLWHWRDWIVDSLNEDKGYDQMIVEMLAGDEIAPENPDTLRATGYLARSYYLFNRTTWLDATIEHTSRGFLGLTLQCAKCHDHKYDPLSQVDYYRFRAIFEPHQVRLDQIPGQTDLEKDGLARAFDDHLDAPTYLHRRGMESDPDTSNPLSPGIPTIFGDLTVVPISLPAFAYAPGARDYVRRDQFAQLDARLSKTDLCNEERLARLGERTALQARIAADDACLTDSPEAEALSKTAAVKEWEAKRLQALYVLKQSQDSSKDRDAKVAEAEKALKQLDESGPQERHTPLVGSLKALESPLQKFEDNPATFVRTSSGRRLALAKWISSRDNPLTARNIVNHVWLRLMGNSFVTDVSDFGLRAKPPKQQAVLDHLSAAFMEHGWSLKWLIREIVLSAAYQRDSSALGADSATIAADPDNSGYWHFPAKRLTAQMLRDTARQLAGDLDLAMGGPPIDPAQSPDSPRRALYFKHSRDDQHRFLAMFDDASVLECYRREASVAPQQALALANDVEIQSLAKKIALTSTTSTQDAFIEDTFTRLLCRAPNQKEHAACREAMEAWQDPERARVGLVLALFNQNDFITIR